LDSHEHEPSYYEVALTNRQVVAGFVILLVCLFGAFLSGVWLGKGGGATSPGPAVASIAKTPEAGEARLEQLTFFGQREAEPREAGARQARKAPPPAEPPPAAAPAPQRAEPTAAELEAERLRKTLEAEMAANRATPAAEPEAEPPPAITAPGTRVRQPAQAETAPATPPVESAPRAATSAPAPPATTAHEAATWIQVFSSSDGANARGLADRLRRSGFQVVVLEAPAAGATTFRVRVGPYATRDEADRAASRLRRDHRLDTWVTDQP
jgi:DedD protein